MTVAGYTATALLASWLIVGPAIANDAVALGGLLASAATADPAGDADAASPDPAQTAAEATDFARGFGLDLAAAYRFEPYPEIGDDGLASSRFSYRGERFAALGPNLSYLMFGRERPWSFKTILASSLDGHDASDTDFLSGMDERRITTEGGFEASYETGVADFSLSTRNDLLSEHDGYRVDAEISRSWWLGRFIMTPEISYSYWDGDRSDYYFGVRPSEAAAGRRAYDLDGTGNWGLSLMGVTKLTPQWFMLAGAKYTYYDEDIEDSPIVDKYYSYRVFFGIGYKFGNGAKDDKLDVDFDGQP